MKKLLLALLVIAVIIGVRWVLLKPATGCCQVGAGKCASGQGVTQEYCEQELDGIYCENKVCNTDTGQCE